MKRGMWVSLFHDWRTLQRLVVIMAFLSVRALAPAQIPGLASLFPLQEEGGFRLAAQPEAAAFCAWANVKGPSRFELVSGLNSITSRMQTEAMLLHTLPWVQDFAFNVGLGFAVDSWSYGANWSLEVPIYSQLHWKVNEYQQIVAFVRVANRGKLMDMQDRDEFRGGIQFRRFHGKGSFMANWNWGTESTAFTFQWSWFFDNVFAARLCLQAIPVGAGMELGWDSGRHTQWIGMSYSSALGIWSLHWSWDCANSKTDDF